MQHARRWGASGVVALAVVAALGVAASGARAEDEVKPARATWVYDVRVVRVDTEVAATVATAPPWQADGRDTTDVRWPELLASLGARGRTTILLDQRVTAVSGEPTEFRQLRKRPVRALRHRTVAAPEQAGAELWETSSVETGVRGSMSASPHGLSFQLEASWEQPGEDRMPIVQEASWKGSHAPLADGETLVLHLRQQPPSAADGPGGLEIYVLVAARPATKR